MVDSLLIKLPDCNKKKLQGISVVEEKLYFFHSDTNAIYVVDRKGGEDNWLNLNCSTPFTPVILSQWNGEFYFQDAGSRNLLIAEDVENSTGRSIIQLDKKHKGRWTGIQGLSPLVRAYPGRVVLITRGGSIGYSTENSEPKWKKFYSNTTTLGIFDASGKCQKGFGHYDEAYFIPGVQWARKFFAVYSTKRNEYLLGNMLTPYIKRYSADFEYLGEFGEAPEKYSTLYPTIIDARDEYISGYGPQIEAMGFYSILEDPGLNKLIRMYTEPGKDTTKLDRAFVRELLYGRQSKEFRCLKPDPSEAAQFEILKSKPILIQLYDNESLQYQGTIHTGFKSDIQYIGHEGDCHIFGRMENNEVTLIWWKLTKTDLDN